MKVPDHLAKAVDNYCIRCWTSAIRETGIRLTCHEIVCPMAKLEHYLSTEADYRRAIQLNCEECPSFCSREDCETCELYAVRNEGTA